MVIDHAPDNALPVHRLTRSVDRAVAIKVAAILFDAITAVNVKIPRRDALAPLAGGDAKVCIAWLTADGERRTPTGHDIQVERREHRAIGCGRCFAF